MWFSLIICQCADAKGYLCCPQRDLEELQRLLKNEIMATEMIFANREQAQAELKKVGLFESYLKVSNVFHQQQLLDDSL